MKQSKRMLFSLLMVVLLVAFAVLPVRTQPVQAAATALSRTGIYLNGIGQEYNLSVMNKKSGAKYYWYSTNRSVVRVNQNGLVRAYKGGRASIRCRVTFRTGTVRTLSCPVVVRVAATAVSIRNKVLASNNCHVIEVGDKYDFNRLLTPSNSTDHTYWEIEDTNLATVDAYGVVTAKKQGLTRLIARTARSRDEVDHSVVNDAINLYISSETAEVIKVNHVNATQLQIAFSEPVNRDTIFNIDGTNSILENIKIVAMRDEFNRLANPYGEMKGELSADGTLLTIRSAKPFSGRYRITIRNIQTKSKKLIRPYSNECDLFDKKAPVYIDTTVDETGQVASINFNEPIDISNMSIQTVSRADGVTMSMISSAILRNKSVYVLSKDGTSLQVNLSSIYAGDKNKIINVTVKGIEDVMGNRVEPELVTMQVFSDTTVKPQANVTGLERIDYYTIKATFDRPIEKTGSMHIKGVFCDGHVNSKNKMEVLYKIPEAIASLSGSQDVTLSGYSAYNVSATAPYTYVTRKMDFTISLMEEAPFLTNYTTDEKTNMLVLTYSKKVHLSLSSGTLPVSKTIFLANTPFTYTDTIPYMAISEDNVVKIILDADKVQDLGTYLVTIPPAFVKDEADIPSNKLETVALLKTQINDSPTANALPDPVGIIQLANDNCTVNVIFENKLDVVSATTASNYVFSGGVTVDSATLIQNDTTKAVVQLKITMASIANTAQYDLTIQNVCGFNNSFSSIQSKPVKVTLKENNPPTLISANVTSSTTIVLTFTENVMGNASFMVTQNGNVLRQAGRPSISGRYVTISLLSPTDGTSGIYTMVTGSLYDTEGNPLVISDGAIAVK